MTRPASLILFLGLITACHSSQAQFVIPAKLPLMPPEAADTLDAIAPASHQVHQAHKAGALALGDQQVAELVTLKAQGAAHAALSGAIERVGSAWTGHLPIPDARATLHSWQNPAGASRSVGGTSDGELVNAAPLALKGAHHQVIDRAKGRNTSWGHPALVAALEQSAAQVAAAYPGSVLALGNLSKKRGGDIFWSMSHNSGRDADIAFFVTDTSTGKPVAMTPDLFEFDDQGLAKTHPEFAFDVPRNWALARALLMNPHADVQFLFVSQPLKDMMLSHAQSLHEPEALMQRARLAMRQPEDALPHDDHFHLRIRCPKEDRLNGCVDRGPRWDWLDWHHDELLERTVAMIPVLEGKDDALKLQALDYVQAIESPYATEFALTYGFTCENPAVRQRAMEVASSLWSYTGAGVMAMAWAIEQPQSEDATRVKLYGMMRQSLDPWVIPFVKRRLADPTLAPRERIRTAWILAHQMDEGLVPYLLDQLESETSPQVRHTLGQVLHRVANRQEQVAWAASSQEERAAALSLWRSWWGAHKVEPREMWVVQGLKGVDQDLSLENLQAPSSIEAMIRALPAAPDYLAYNLNRTLRQATGRWSPLELSDGRKLYQRWHSWWEVHAGSWVVARN